MTRLALLAIAAVSFLSLAPASAQNNTWHGDGWRGSNANYDQRYGNNPPREKSRRHSRNRNHMQSGQGWGNGWQHGGWSGGWNNGWNSRNASDPSFSNRAGINNAYRTGRCVIDLGYGRYEYCGW